MIFVNSVTEPGHPCVITSGICFGPTPFSWIRWMSSPPTFALNCAKPFSADSAFRQSYASRQYVTSSRTAARFAP